MSFGREYASYDPYSERGSSNGHDTKEYMSLAQFTYKMQMDLAVQKLELKAAQIRRDLGDAEIDRRIKRMQADWRHEQAEYAAYRREVRAARERNDRHLPPNPHYDPDGWRAWRTKQRHLHLEGRQ
jgi:hypothetical protein